MDRRNWQRNELVLALNLYCKLPFGRYHGRNPEIVRLAKHLGRTPNAVAMKLSNFASLDPVHRERGIAGLSNVSRADREVWNEFHDDWYSLAIESEMTYIEAVGDSLSDVPPDGRLALRSEQTERSARTRVRIGQSFFRAVILTAYGDRCCVCGLPVPSLLVASHIVPWRASKRDRLNPRNGLCLCAIHDSGFDRGYVTVNAQFEFVVGRELRQFLPDDAVDAQFLTYDQKQIRLPDKFLPDQSLLAVHRERYFIG